MAALAESLVDEWLNRQGFFTVRGLKRGVDEIDLLAVRPSGTSFEAWHVEVQASFRPISYISKIPKELVATFGASGTSAKHRPPEVLRSCVKAWVQGKYLSSKKCKMREEAWQSLAWKFFLVHAEMRWQEELDCIAEAGITLLPLLQVLEELRNQKQGLLRGGAGTDIAELIEYFTK
ncbi:hypothetical protein [Paraherbaspirillum soli]|uniref:Restriction endonuclease type IV Mrr domain-containing protein n=1 Tax=Paraherbaspirillum soli TaxID=631222 RepID=A0ABW0MD45_9BURK